MLATRYPSVHPNTVVKIVDANIILASALRNLLPTPQYLKVIKSHQLLKPPLLRVLQQVHWQPSLQTNRTQNSILQETVRAYSKLLLLLSQPPLTKQLPIYCLTKAHNDHLYSSHWQMRWASNLTRQTKFSYPPLESIHTLNVAQIQFWRTTTTVCFDRTNNCCSYTEHSSK